MSHDIRTPLNAVIGYSSLLEQAATDPEKVREYACKIRLSGNTLLDLINDMLEMSRIQSGKTKLKYETFKLIRVIEEVEAAIKPQSQKKKQEFRITFDPHRYRAVFSGDREKLCRVLINLLSNAVKYTPEGGHIELTVEIMASDKVMFRIKDDGVGMSEDFIERVFEPFSREEDGQNGQVQGTGLGMSIAKEIVDMMNGYIGVDSESGVGTHITVFLELQPAKEDILAVGDACVSGKALSGMRFLIAEDNEINGEIISEMLAVKGAESLVVPNGMEAVETLRNSLPGRFDAVLMDVRMPVMDGYTAAQEIRRLERRDHREIIVVAMTADAFEHDVKLAFEAGMDAHIAKPVDIDAFVNTFLSLQKKTRLRESAAGV
jgi:CheY-like chemotaxis protein